MHVLLIANHARGEPYHLEGHGHHARSEDRRAAGRARQGLPGIGNTKKMQRSTLRQETCLPLIQSTSCAVAPATGRQLAATAGASLIIYHLWIYLSTPGEQLPRLLQRYPRSEPSFLVGSLCSVRGPDHPVHPRLQLRVAMAPQMQPRCLDDFPQHPSPFALQPLLPLRCHCPSAASV